MAIKPIINKNAEANAADKKLNKAKVQRYEMRFDKATEDFCIKFINVCGCKSY